MKPSASDHLTLNESDVRAMVCLLGEVCALPGGHAEKKRRLMNGLCGLIQADAWVWTLACQYERGKPSVYVGFMRGGFEEERFPKYLQAVEHPASVAMTGALVDEMRQRKAHVTRTIEQIDSCGQFSSFPAAPLWREAKVGTLLISMRPLDERSASGVGIYRNMPASPFTPREARIAHILLTEVPWLHEQGWPQDRGAQVPNLPPRIRLVLEMLLQSYSRKQIASHLEISENTVTGYVKEVYSRLGVQSHAELIARFFQGDGGDGGEPEIATRN